MEQSFRSRLSRRPSKPTRVDLGRGSFFSGPPESSTSTGSAAAVAAHTHGFNGNPSRHPGGRIRQGSRRPSLGLTRLSLSSSRPSTTAGRSQKSQPGSAVHPNASVFRVQAPVTGLSMQDGRNVFAETAPSEWGGAGPLSSASFRGRVPPQHDRGLSDSIAEDPLPVGIIRSLDEVVHPRHSAVRGRSSAHRPPADADTRQDQ